MAGLSNVIGFDDAPFTRNHRGDVQIFGPVCARTRLDGLLTGKVRRDGANSTSRMYEMIHGSQFKNHVQAVLLDGIAVAGFNVVDIHALNDALKVPVMVVMRRLPNFPAIKGTLLNKIPGGARKWKLIEQAGTPEKVRRVYVQRAGLTLTQAQRLLAATTLHGNMPEAIRLAHIIASGVTEGKSRGRA